MSHAYFTTADDLSPDLYALYRRARFGEAGRCGSEGVARAGLHHGVGIRAWFMYESGKRAPAHAERVKIARWLNSHAASADRIQQLADASASGG